MSGRQSARWDRINSLPKRFVLFIGADHKPAYHDCHACAVAQCKMAQSMYDKGLWVRMIDVGQHGHVTMIRVSPKESANAQ